MQLQASALARQPHTRKMPVPRPSQPALQTEGPRGSEMLSGKETTFLQDMELTRALKQKPFSREEEIAIFRIYQRLAERAKRVGKTLERGKANGGEQALRKEADELDGWISRITGIMVMANLGLVCKVARREAIRFNYPLQDVENLIGEGKIGAMKAVKKFKLDKGCKFATYAEYWIRQAITRHLQDTWRMVRLPVYKNEELVRMHRFIRSYAKKNGRDPDASEIAEGTGMPQEKVEKLACIKPDDKTALCEIDEDNTEDPAAEDAFDALARKELREKLTECIERLNRDRRKIFIQRFGLKGKEPLTLEEVGEGVGLVRERIRQIQLEEQKKMRKREPELHDYL